MCTKFAERIFCRCAVGEEFCKFFPEAQLSQKIFQTVCGTSMATSVYAP